MKKKPREIRDWIARRRGDFYCSPSCGRRCTWKEFVRATERSARLAKHLGEGWTPRVWENLGWHWAAVSACGQIKVLASDPRGSFSAFFGSTRDGGEWVSTRPSPRKAVKGVIRAAREEANRINTMLQKVAT